MNLTNTCQIHLILTVILMLLKALEMILSMAIQFHILCVFLDVKKWVEMFYF